MVPRSIIQVCVRRLHPRHSTAAVPAIHLLLLQRIKAEYIPGTAYTMLQQVFLAPSEKRVFMFSKQANGLTSRHFLQTAELRPPRPSPRDGHYLIGRGPPRARLRQAGTAAEETDEKIHLASIQEPPSAERPRIFSAVTTCKLVSYTSICTVLL